MALLSIHFDWKIGRVSNRMRVRWVLQISVPFVIEISVQCCRKVVGFQILSHSHLECRSEKLGGVVAKIRTPPSKLSKGYFRYQNMLA